MVAFSVSMSRFRVIRTVVTASIACIVTVAEIAPAVAIHPSSNLKPDIRSSVAEIGPSCRHPRALTFRLHVENVGTLASFASADAPLVVADSERPPWVGREAMPVIPAGGSADVLVEMPTPIHYGANHFTISLFGVRSATFTATVANAIEHHTRGSNGVAAASRSAGTASSGSGSMRVDCTSLSK
jgi:hypothetical protein